MSTNMTHDDTLKWEFGGRYYCLHVQSDSDAASNPAEDESLVKLAFWGSHRSLGNVDTKGYEYVSDYWRDLVRENMDDDELLKAAKGLFTLRVTEEPDGSIVIENEAESEMVRADPGDTKEAILGCMSAAQCQTVLLDKLAYMPVWIYEHSGITISCGDRRYPYDDRWDSGLLGYAVVFKSEIMKEIPDTTEKTWHDVAMKNIKAVVKAVDQYVTGDVWFYTLYETDSMPANGEEPDWQEIDSCGGFYGMDIMESGMADAVGYGLKHAIANGKEKPGTASSHRVTVYKFGAL